MKEQEYIAWLRAHPPQQQHDAEEMISAVNRRIDALPLQTPRPRRTRAPQRERLSPWDLVFRLSLSAAVAILLSVFIGQTLTVGSQYAALERRMQSGQDQPLQLSIMYDISRDAFPSLAEDPGTASPLDLLERRSSGESYRVAKSETEGIRFYRALRFSSPSRVGISWPATREGPVFSLHLHSITITLGISTRG